MLYFDASALAKRYVREKGSLKVRRLLASDVPATSRYSGVEITSALARRVREGAISVEDCERAVAALGEDLAAMLVVELTPWSRDASAGAASAPLAPRRRRRSARQLPRAS